VSGWQKLNSFTHPRQALAAVAANGYLYVVGGVDGNNRYVHPVEYAQILDDGKLGPWRQTSVLQQGRLYLAAASHGDYLYALGGGDGQLGDDNLPLASVERAKINTDGSSQAWQHHSYLNTPRRGLEATVINNRLYAVGGYNGQFLKSSEFIGLAGGRAPAHWQMVSEQAQVDRYIHATATLATESICSAGMCKRLAL
jgi:N-acetylneuraminic acid mutarotase